MAAKTTDNLGEICPVCNDTMQIYAVGACDHPICYKCSTRMRILCDQRHCAICRANIPKVLFLKKLHRFSSVDYSQFQQHAKFGIYFDSKQSNNAYSYLLEHRCQYCRFMIFPSFSQLKDHMKREHSLFACDLCVNFVKVLSTERKFYTREDLARHRRTGDRDDRSYRGHPLCEFCDERYLDNDELAKHLRKDHHLCHFCEADGISNQFYAAYPTLKDHFRSEHFLCEEGACASDQVQFTNAFRSEIDLKGHRVQEHGRALGKAEARQARTIQIEFDYADRGHQRGQRGRGFFPRGDGGSAPRFFGRKQGGLQSALTDDDGSHSGHGGGRGGRAEWKQRYERESFAHKREERNMARALAASLNEQRSSHVSVIPTALMNAARNVPGNVSALGSNEAGNTDFRRKREEFPGLKEAAAADVPATAIKLGDSARETVSYSPRQNISKEEARGREIRDKETRDEEARDRETLADRLALSAGFSVGRLEKGEADFPTLTARASPIPSHSGKEADVSGKAGFGLVGGAKASSGSAISAKKHGGKISGTGDSRPTVPDLASTDWWFGSESRSMDLGKEKQPGSNSEDTTKVVPDFKDFGKAHNGITVVSGDRPKSAESAGNDKRGKDINMSSDDFKSWGSRPVNLEDSRDFPSLGGGNSSQGTKVAAENSKWGMSQTKTPQKLPNQGWKEERKGKKKVEERKNYPEVPGLSYKEVEVGKNFREKATDSDEGLKKKKVPTATLR